jgi:SAM-dependent methyltransferase
VLAVRIPLPVRSKSVEALLRQTVAPSGRLRVTEKIIRRLSPRHVLELGAGDYSFDYCQAYGSARSWTKVDLAEPCDIICDLNSQGVILPVEDRAIDCVVCTEVIEHLLWPQSLLLECHRVLMPNGVLLVSVPNCVSLSYRIAWMLGRIPSCAACGNLPEAIGPTVYLQQDGDLIAGHVIDFNTRRLRLLLESCGFQVDSIKSSGIFWHRQMLPPWLVPAGFASNLIATCRKPKGV